MSRKSAMIPRVSPHNSSGRLLSLDPAWLLRDHVFHLWKSDNDLELVLSGTNPGIELQYKLSVGTNRTAENSIMPVIQRVAMRVTKPPRLA